MKRCEMNVILHMMILHNISDAISNANVHVYIDMKSAMVFIDPKFITSVQLIYN